MEPVRRGAGVQGVCCRSRRVREGPGARAPAEGCFSSMRAEGSWPSSRHRSRGGLARDGPRVLTETGRGALTLGCRRLARTLVHDDGGGGGGGDGGGGGRAAGARRDQLYHCPKSLCFKPQISTRRRRQCLWCRWRNRGYHVCRGRWSV